MTGFTPKGADAVTAWEHAWDFPAIDHVPLIVTIGFSVFRAQTQKVKLDQTNFFNIVFVKLRHDLGFASLAIQGQKIR